MVLNIWYIKPDMNMKRQEVLDKIKNIVSQEVYKKVERIKVDDELIRKACSEYLKVKVLKEKLGIHDDIIYNEYGKPYFQSGAIHFNISHSGGVIVLATFSSQVGIDIEKIREIDYNEIARMFFSEQIVTNILTSSQKITFFFKSWSIIESYLKYTGEGLRNNLRTLEIDFFKNTIFDTENNSMSDVIEIVAFDGYAAFVITDNYPDNIQLSEIFFQINC